MYCYWVTLLIRHTQHDICICMATSSRNDEALSRNDEALSRNDGALSRNDGAVFRNPKLWNSTELHRMETKRAIPSKCRPHVFVGLASLFVTYMNRQGKQSQSESHWSITTLQSRAVHILEVGAGLSINAANHHVVLDLKTRMRVWGFGVWGLWFRCLRRRVLGFRF